MIVYKDCTDYNILGEIISVFSTETDYGLSTVIEFDKQYYYYLGNEPNNIESAIFAWQDYYNYQLCDSELAIILEDNKINKFGESNGNSEETSKKKCEETNKESFKETCKENNKKGC